MRQKKHKTFNSDIIAAHSVEYYKRNINNISDILVQLNSYTYTMYMCIGTSAAVGQWYSVM